MKRNEYIGKTYMPKILWTTNIIALTTLISIILPFCLGTKYDNPFLISTLPLIISFVYCFVRKIYYVNIKQDYDFRMKKVYKPFSEELKMVSKEDNDENVIYLNIDDEGENGRYFFPGIISCIGLCIIIPLFLFAISSFWVGCLLLIIYFKMFINLLYNGLNN